MGIEIAAAANAVAATVQEITGAIVAGGFVALVIIAVIIIILVIILSMVGYIETMHVGGWEFPLFLDSSSGKQLRSYN